MSKGIALLVGLKHLGPSYYPWTGENGCWGCELDVDNMERILDNQGFEIHMLKTESATHDNILKKMSEIARTVDKSDIFVFYYSGHGGQQLDKDGDELDGRDETLVAYDKEIIDDKLYEKFKLFPAGMRLVMISDSCNSGTNYRGRRDISFQEATPINPFPYSVARTKKEVSFQLIHMGGCRDGSASQGYRGGGAFTTALTNAWANGNFSGSYNDLFEKAKKLIQSPQEIQYNEVGNVTDAFRSEKPFTIKTQSVSDQDRETVLKAIELIDKMDILPVSLEHELISSVEKVFPISKDDEVVAEVVSDKEYWVVVDESFDEPRQYAPFYEEDAEDYEVTKEGVETIVVKQLEYLGRMQDILLDTAEQALRHLPFQSTGCRRDDRMASLAMIIAGSLMMPIPLIVTGGAIGVIIGIVAGAAAAEGGGSIPLLAGAAGMGIGATAGVAQLIVVGCVVARILADIDREVPLCGPNTRGEWEAEPIVEIDVDEAMDFIDFEREDSEVSEQTARVSSNNYAGTYESLLVQSLASIFSNKVVDISIKWENSHHIPRHFKSQWRALRPFLKPAFDVLRSIKQYKRLPKGRPAQSLKGPLKWVTTWISGDTTAMRNSMFEALEIGHMTLRVENGYLKWTTPKALRNFGLPPTISKQLPKGAISVAGFTASLNPGPFYIDLGKPSISENMIKVSYTIKNGSRLASVKVYYTLPNRSRFYLLNSSAKTSSTIRGSLYYKMSSVGPVIDTVKLGGVTVSMPKLKAPPIPIAGSIISNVQNQVKSQIKKFASSALPFKSVFNGAADEAKKNMLKMFRDIQSTLGFENIQQIRSIKIDQGSIRVNIGGYKTEFRLPPFWSKTQLQGAIADAQKRLNDLR